MGSGFTGPHIGCQMFLLVDLVVGWLWEQVVTLSASGGIFSFPGMLERDSIWNKGGPTFLLHFDDQVSTGLINNE